MSCFARAMTLALTLFSLTAAAPPLQAQTAANRIPALMANNQCDSNGNCVRQMLVYRQLETWQQAMLINLLNAMPVPAAASKPTGSCSWHQTILVCSFVSSEGTCSCVHTLSGGGCIGTSPTCPASL